MSRTKPRVKEYQLVVIGTCIIIFAVPGRSAYDVYLRVLLVLTVHLTTVVRPKDVFTSSMLNDDPQFVC